MAFSYTKLPDGKYKIMGLDNLENPNQEFLELYNRFDRAVLAWGYKKFGLRYSVLDLENSLREEGKTNISEMISTIRRTRNILTHGNTPAFTINIDMIKNLVKLIIDREEKINKLNNK